MLFTNFVCLNKSNSSIFEGLTRIFFFNLEWQNPCHFVAVCMQYECPCLFSFIFLSKQSNTAYQIKFLFQLELFSAHRFVDKTVLPYTDFTCKQAPMSLSLLPALLSCPDNCDLTVL